MKKLIAAFFLLASAPAVAQWQVPDHAVPIGNGAGVTGFNSAAPGTSGVPLISQGASSDPVFGPATVAGGGTGLASGSSGGIPWFNSASTMLSSVPGNNTGIIFPGPTWAGQSNIYNGIFFSNGFPLSGMFGANGVGLTQAVACAIDIPASANAANHSTGCAGYARTASATHGAVGIYGQGSVGANSGVGAWGGNFLVSNCGNTSCPGSSGFSAQAMWGVEIDVNMATLSGGTTPNIPVRGLNIVGDSLVQSSNAVFFAIDIDSPGVFQSPKILWKRAFNTVNGSSNIGISLGAQAATGPANSQDLNFRSLNGASTELTGGIAQDSSGQLVFHAGPGGGYAFADNSFVSLLAVDVNGNALATGSNKSKSPSGGIGYATGAGGTVTQATSKSTAITVNAVTGTITMNNAALAANTAVSFVFNNTSVAATDLIATAHESGGTTGGYLINGRALGAGQAAIDIRNVTAGSLSEAVVIRFAVIKSVNN